MSHPHEDFSSLGFAKKFFLPALLIFLIPTISLILFIYIQGAYDREGRDAALQQIRADQSLTAEQRANAEELFSNVPFSQLITIPGNEDMVSPQAAFDYTTFRWAIRFSLFSIIGGIVVIVLSAFCVVASLRSQ